MNQTEKTFADYKGTENVLVVEDEEMTRNMVTEILEGLGYTVLNAPNAETAIEISDDFEDDIHLLLSDVIMPLMNGKQLSNQLAMSRPTMKVLFMSGYTDNMLAPYGILEENIHFLQKPFSVKILTQKVRETLDS
ncbi:MAG: hypothetical protein AUJ47_10790 [Candidatus Marinimicrobia bacterium CG1_02_48_14]|nr:MAG: hypothetical protein AUJ47_10790 [Candidatus Marinimicrobia bacterium CG1_02_48_14]PIZ67608.1 MAG: hypothetical protein COY19_05235 [Candidatus Marinimicrobia bacterium CG_4_10_14_0_2_um_filter_48_9]